MRIALLPAVALALVSLADTADAGGFELRNFDAKGIGLSNAFTGQADTPAAVAYNPAGMSQLDGVQASIGFWAAEALIHFKATDPAEGEENDRRNPAIVPSLFGTIELTDELHLGLGIFAPFGTNVRWEDDWPGRYIAIHTVISSLEFAPMLSYKIQIDGETSLALGAGGGVMQTELQLKQAVDFSSLGAPDGYVRLQGKNQPLDWVWQAGLLLGLNDGKFKIGATYISSVEKINVQGHGVFYNIPTNPLTGQPALPAVTNARTRLAYPDRFKFGASAEVIEDTLTINADFAWTNWSRLREVFVHLTDIGRTSLLDLRWKDSYFVAVGAEYKAVEDLLALRVGTFYDQSPTQNKTDSPSIPDQDRYGFTLGAGVTPHKSFSIDFAYQFVILKEFTKDNDIGATSVLGGNPRATGEFSTVAHIVALTFGLKF